MINRVVLVGRLTRDPELRNSNTGNPVCNFTLALDNRQKAADGTKTTTFINCVVFSQQADNVSKFVRKGSLVGVEGRLQQRNYERKDGTKASVIEVLCDSVQFLEPKSTNEASETVVFNDTPSSKTNDRNLDTIEVPDESDDLPF